MRFAGRFAASAAIVLACGVFASSATAALYKWTDANGRVVYSDVPPNDANIKVEKVGAPPPPADPNAVKELAVKELEFKKRQMDAQEKNKKSETLRADAAKRSEQCARTQAHIKQLGALQVAYVRYNDKGEIVYVDDAARLKERAELETWVKANCPT